MTSGIPFHCCHIYRWVGCSNWPAPFWLRFGNLISSLRACAESERHNRFFFACLLEKCCRPAMDPPRHIVTTGFTTPQPPVYIFTAPPPQPPCGVPPPFAYHPPPTPTPYFSVPPPTLSVPPPTYPSWTVEETTTTTVRRVMTFGAAPPPLAQGWTVPPPLAQGWTATPPLRAAPATLVTEITDVTNEAEAEPVLASHIVAASTPASEGTSEAGGAVSMGTSQAGGAVSMGTSQAGGAVSMGTSQAGGAVSKGTSQAGGAVSMGTSQAGGAVSMGTSQAGGAVSMATSQAGGAVSMGTSQAGGAVSTAHVAVASVAPTAGHRAVRASARLARPAGPSKPEPAEPVAGPSRPSTRSSSKRDPIDKLHDEIDAMLTSYPGNARDAPKKKKVKFIDSDSSDEDELEPAKLLKHCDSPIVITDTDDSHPGSSEESDVDESEDKRVPREEELKADICCIELEELNRESEIMRCYPCTCAKACVEHAVGWLKDNRTCYHCRTPITDCEAVPNYYRF
ncbi:formin-binding protein 4-like isoform X2 [Thrips palmi]|uniref:Formin-binding protein 4-like isoform X2 n=1 Tax=Thrips palmi TaxID=161013 RepID=A0A6P8ZD98_THRPL|nr:formin-binding protein 4-like isoform X2 [Thrips palmi]